MKKLLGTVVILAVIALSNCDSGTGGGGSTTTKPPVTGGSSGGAQINGTPRWDNNGPGYSIVFYVNTDLNANKFIAATGWTVTADGIVQVIGIPEYGNYNGIRVDNDRIEIFFGNNQNFTGSTVIKMSYDGTGELAGKLAEFSNITVTYDENMYN